ncbi:hypothetical protein O7606_19475 [Micromonospora sp. WMMD882]|uniref:hypothetical protein n=1 Tax=Micromonospora sp. WMMD882 TaxID=3015151 RepID=UPI00248CBDD9|nr:hypothetical protein [Micromonospora sp. WMMD882]WBB78392.1 hypothetical protein O7606_19475 [Micromonospora sp. WMMD882]
MSVFPARRAVSAGRALPPTGGNPPQDEPSGTLAPVRPSPFGWARRRRAERGARRMEAAGARALGQLDSLGPAWHVIEWPRADPSDALLGSGHDDRAGFLAIGPSGLFAISIVDHGRNRVLVAGDVVQINGKRPPYVADARRDAKRASKVLTKAVGKTIPVAPVLAFVGSGDISVYGLPKDILMATHRELDRLLVAGGARISPATAEKLAQVAQHPATWMDGTYRPAADYRWYEDSRMAADKRANHR